MAGGKPGDMGEERSCGGAEVWGRSRLRGNQQHRSPGLQIKGAETKQGPVAQLQGDSKKVTSLQSKKW